MWFVVVDFECWFEVLLVSHVISAWRNGGRDQLNPEAPMDLSSQ